MPILLLLTAFISGTFFHSKELFAQPAQTPQTKKVMISLNQVFQENENFIKEHDRALAVFISDMKDCPYKNNFLHHAQSVLDYTCDELIDKALWKNHLSYFLLKKSVEESQFDEEERKQAVKDSLQKAKDDKCQASSHLLSEPSPPKVEDAVGECIQRGNCSEALYFTYTKLLCNTTTTEEQEKEELIAYLSSELKSCPTEELDGFSCKALIEEAKKAELSYFQVRYAVQKVKEELESSVALAEKNEKKTEEKQQIAKP